MSQLEIAPRAEEQIRQIGTWWREHRSTSPSLFANEMASALEALAANPTAGVPYSVRRGVVVRRLLLQRTRYHVYFSYDDDRDLVSVRAVWHGTRGSGPPLR